MHCSKALPQQCMKLWQGSGMSAGDPMANNGPRVLLHRIGLAFGEVAFNTLLLECLKAERLAEA